MSEVDTGAPVSSIHVVCVILKNNKIVSTTADDDNLDLYISHLLTIYSLFLDT